MSPPSKAKSSRFEQSSVEEGMMPEQRQQKESSFRGKKEPPTLLRAPPRESELRDRLNGVLSEESISRRVSRTSWVIEISPARNLIGTTKKGMFFKKV